MTMVIARKKGKFENFDQSICYVPQKKACRVQIRIEKVRLQKNWKK